jgi:hypothetical protein
MAKIFISYNHESKTIADTLVADIQGLGHTVWIDQELSGGQVWWNKILAQIRESEVFVFIMNPDALKSTACKREYKYAAAVGKPILPILFSKDVSTDHLPSALSQIHFVDYRERNPDAVIRLSNALSNVPAPEPLPDPLPDPPEVPISYLGSLIEQIETGSKLKDKDQKSLFLDLKRGLRDPETAKDSRELLKRLRERHDLLATIGDEIDELIGRTMLGKLRFHFKRKKAIAYGSLFSVLVSVGILVITYPFFKPNSPSDNINAADMTNLIDSLTNLMWTTSDGGKKFTWTVAKNYCDGLEFDTYKDWRLPTINELKKLYDPAEGGGYNIRKPFKLTDWWVWSATTEGSDSVVGFKFYDGNPYSVGLNKLVKGSALCVRDADE